MPSRSSRTIHWVISILVAGLAIWLLFREVDAEDFFAALRSTKPLWLLLAVVAQLACHVCRCLRWGAHLRPLAQTTFTSHLSINTIGHLAVNLLPFRTGELVRPALLTRKEGVVFSKGLALAMVDRLHDVAGLAILFVVLIAFAPLPAESIDIGGMEMSIREDGRRVVAVIAILSAAVALVPLLLGTRGHALVERVLGAHIAGIYESYRQGVITVVKPRALLNASFWNLAAWATFVFMLWALFKAFSLDDLGFWPAIAAIVFLHVGLLLPAPPGLAGVFEAFAAAPLILYGVPASTAAGYAVTLHVIQVAALLPLGFYFLWRDGLSLRQLARLGRREQ